MNVMQLLLKRYKRKINKVIRGVNVLSILFCILISFVTPPFNIYADDYSGSTIVGFNVNLYEVTESYTTSGTYSGMTYVYEVVVTLDKDYVGMLEIGGTVNFYPPNSTNLTSFTLPSRNRFVNGNTIRFTFKITGDGYQATDRPALNNVVLTYGNHNLTSYDLISSLDDIIDILNDLYSNTDGVEGLLNDQFDQLELIVDGIGLSNQYLEVLTQMRQWNFPIESFGAVMYMLTNGFELADFYEYDYYTFPVFKVNQNDVIAKQYLNNNQTFIYICMTNNNVYASTLNNYFSVDYGTIQNFRSLGRFIYNGNTAYIFKFEVLNNSGSSRYINLNYIGANNKVIMPIYYNASTIKFISTDFALRFGLTNDLLDNLNIIANGTTQSNTSGSNLETQKGSFDTTSNNLYNSENAFNTDMNNKLQSIDTSFNPSTSFGSKFLSSADWVRTQFNNLTSTSPFGTVLSFSMLLGLSLLIIGKVFK